MKKEPESGEIWYCKDFPYQESKRKEDVKTRTVLILEQADDNYVKVMMLTTGKHTTPYDVPIKDDDILEGKTREKSRARVFIIRDVPKHNLTTRKFIIKEEKLNNIISKLIEFSDNRYKDSRHFRDWCTFINLKKITDIEGRKIQTIDEFEESREATGLEVALINHEICKSNNTNNTLGYISWEYHSGRKMIGHVLSMFIISGNAHSLHYLGDGYSVINTDKIGKYEIAMLRLISKYEYEINEEGHRTLGAYKILDKSEMDVIDSVEYRGMLVSEFLEKFITSAPPAILESVENVSLYDSLQG